MLVCIINSFKVIRHAQTVLDDSLKVTIADVIDMIEKIKC